MSEEEVGAVAPEGTPVEGAQGGSGTPAEHDRGDYMARISNEPDFAVDQIKDKDRKISTMTEQLKRLDGAGELVEAAGGVDQLRDFVSAGYQLRQRPELFQVFEEAVRTGQVPMLQTEAAGQQVDDDPYMDPEVKELRNTVKSLTDKLDSVTQTYEQRFAQAETRSSMAIVEDNIAKVIDTYGVNEDIKNQLSDTIMKKVREAEKGAKMGNQQHLGLLNTLAGEQGIETLKMMSLGVIESNMDAIVAARQNRQASQVASHATDEPGVARTAGGSGSEPDIKPIGDWVRRSLEKNTRKMGRDPNKIWNALS